MNSVKKDPAAILDYGFNWLSWLAGDTIQTSTWTVPTGLTKVSDSATTSTTTAWISGGTAGTDYTVVNRIVTAGGRTDERSIIFQVRER